MLKPRQPNLFYDMQKASFLFKLPINVYAPWKAEDSDTEIIYSILRNELKQNSKNTFI